MHRPIIGARGVLGAAKLSLEQSADNCSSENLAQEALANNVAYKFSYRFHRKAYINNRRELIFPMDPTRNHT